jgi:sulfatase maturation enzyme AslB (radical SAM superfamily)
MVSITGGEPTLYIKELLVSARMLKKNKIKISLVTNARILSNKRITEEIVNSGIKRFIVALHGEEDIHETITNVPGSYNQTIDGIRNLISMGADVRINYVVVKENLDSILPVIKTLTAIGVKEFNIQRFVMKGKGYKDYKRFSFSPNKFQPYLNDIVDLINSNDVMINFEFFNDKYFKGFEGYAPKISDAITFLHQSRLTDRCYFDKRFCNDCFLDGVCLVKDE